MKFQLGPQNDCPNCAHPLSGHEGEYGCLAGWSWNKDGLAVTIGCSCNLALTG